MPLQVETLQESFRKVKPQADDFVDSFYENLFTDYPASRPLFQHSDMKKQTTMLKACLLMVVENLRHPGRMQEMLGGLGARHVGYGALPEHYPLVGNSLLKTFEQYLEDDWTPEVKEAWIEAYAAITTLMLEGCDYPEDAVALESTADPDSTKPPEPVAAPATMTNNPGFAQPPQVAVSPEVNSATLNPVPAAVELAVAPETLPSPNVASETSINAPSTDTASNFPALPLAGGIVGAGAVIWMLLLLL